MGRTPARVRRPSTRTHPRDVSIRELLDFRVGVTLPPLTPFAASRANFATYRAMLDRYELVRDAVRERWPDGNAFAERLRAWMIAHPDADVERIGLRLAHPPRVPRSE